MANYTRITQRSAVAGLEPFSTTTDAGFATLVGQRFDLNDGRQVALVQNAGSAIGPGLMVQGPATVANHQTLTVTAVQAYSANGNTPATVTATLGATATTLNEYALGLMVVKSGTGAGQTLRIASHPAAAGDATGVVFTLADVPVTALDTTSVVNLIKVAHGSANGTDFTTNGVIINPTTSTGQLVGATYYNLPASTATVATYGFVATKGVWAVLNDANTAANLPLMRSSNTAGALMTFASTGANVGYAIQAGVSTDYGAVFLNV